MENANTQPESSDDRYADRTAAHLIADLEQPGEDIETILNILEKRLSENKNIDSADRKKIIKTLQDHGRMIFG